MFLVRAAPPFFTKCLRGWVFAIVKGSFFDLASGNPHDMDGHCR
jgi:hypothetical protein